MYYEYRIGRTICHLNDDKIMLKISASKCLEEIGCASEQLRARMFD